MRGSDNTVWDQSVFSYNQDRLIKADIVGRFLAEVNQQAKRKRLLSSDHFSVDGTFLLVPKLELGNEGI